VISCLGLQFQRPMTFPQLAAELGQGSEWVSLSGGGFSFVYKGS